MTQNKNAGGDGRIKKVWNVVVSGFLLIAFILIVAFTVPKLIGFEPYVVTSGSMEPKYPVGSLIYVESVEPEEISVGDAITFYMEGTKIVATHQVYKIDKQNEQFRTQGINNRDSEGNILQDAFPVSYDSFIGRPVLCIPQLGNVNRFCTTAPGYYLLIIFAVLMSGISFAVDRIPADEKSKKNQLV